MKKVLVTGATGFVLSNIVCELIRKGYQVYCLARSKKGRSAQERIDEALSFVDPNISKSDYIVLEGDITEENLGIDERQIKDIEFDEFWHGAASISFKDEEEAITRKINVDGTRNVLDFISTHQIHTLHYFGTAYICGRYEKLRFFETDLNKGQEFKNPYEATKFEAEILVQDYQKNNPKSRVSIYRLGVVVGDSRSGRANNFSGYYALARMFYFLKNLVLREIKQDPTKCLKAGFVVYNNNCNANGNRQLSLPVQIPCHPRQSVNLVTIDYVVEVIGSLSQNSKNAGVFHIVNQSPPTIEWLFKTSLDFLGLINFQLVELGDKDGLKESLCKVAKSKFLRDIELDIWKMCGVYIPYLAGEPIFDDFRTRSATGMIHPEITESTIRTLLDYALSVDFGRKKATEVKEVVMAS